MEIPLLVVAEAPGVNEVEKGKTLIGASGKEIRTAISNAGVDSNAVSYTNTILCRPDGGDLERYLRDVKKTGKPSPLDCCRPRLKRELHRSRFAILMGGASLTGAGIRSSIMKLRGTPVQIPDGPQAIPVLHAAFVLRESGRVMRPIFHADVAKAIRFARGGNTWVPPRYFVAETAEHIINFFAQNHPYLAVDTETDGVDPWLCRLRRIGIGTYAEALIYRPLSVKGHMLLSPEENDRQKRAIIDGFNRCPKLGFHNYYGFDSIVLGQHGIVVQDAKIVDSLIGHQIGPTSELPHRLDFLGSIFTDAPFWKDDVKHSNVKDDATLDTYLSVDIAVTHISVPQVGLTLQQSNQLPIYDIDVAMATIGRSMSGLGILIDPARQLKFASEYQEKAERLTLEFQALAGRDINPGSYPQLKKLFYEELGLPILDEHLTDTGEASTDEATLLDLLGMGLDKRAEKIIHAVLGFREADKILGTNTGRVEKGCIVGGPRIHSDGRVRTTWRPGKTTGRWGSSDPINMQNVPKKLRAMFVPAQGHVFVAADYSALELRIIALVSGDQPLIDAFKAFDEKRGPDVHIFNACGVFRCQPADVTDEVRNFIKRFVYALSYGAQPPRIYQTLCLLRDDDLKPLFPHISLAEIERTYAAYWLLHPAVPAWKKKLIQGWRKLGFIETPWHHRRRYFIGGESAEEMSNLPIQGGGADLQNTAVKTFTDAFPFDFEERTGLIIQGHDALVAECKENDAERVKGIMEWAMQKRIGDMLFPAAAKVAKDWKAAS
jgi:DNA polymerase-1